MYFPILFMLIGLIFRAVASEFRHLAQGRHRWYRAFFGGSLVATLSQGIVLGTVVQGIPVAGCDFAGGSLGWLTRFALLSGAGLVVGYGLPGACWLVMKTEGTLQAWARRMARRLTWGLAAFVALVSV